VGPDVVTAFQFDNFWLAVVLWLLIYPCDYYLTLIGNRLWMKYGQAHIEFEGSYELNAYYQKDVDALRRFSPRFVVQWLFWPVWLALFWWASDSLKAPGLFTAAVGYLLLLELTIMARHVRNIALFNLMKESQGIDGHLKYAEWVSVNLLAREYAYWALLFFILFCLSGSWLFVGGMLSGLSMFIRYSRRGAKLRREKAAQTVA
jgi:hypothetical protein